MPVRLSSGDLGYRRRIYEHFVEFGRAPAGSALLDLGPVGGDRDESLQRLHDAHVIVLDGKRSIRMALGELRMGRARHSRCAGHRRHDRGDVAR